MRDGFVLLVAILLVFVIIVIVIRYLLYRWQLRIVERYVKQYLFLSR